MTNPIFGRKVEEEHRSKLAQLNSVMGSGSEVLGTIPTDQPLMDPAPLTQTAQWTGPAGTVEMEDGPPPWELEDKRYTLSDARRYVDVPQSWTVRWANPKLFESAGGLEHWKPVTKGDPRVKIKVLEMVAPDGCVRRGGPTAGPMSDILVYMPTSWVISRRALLKKETDRMTQVALNKFEQMKEEFTRQGFSLDSAQHPVYTQVEGRSIRD